MTYIYLNEYDNGYLYVGSHTWKGSGIDPSYQGSSKVAEHYGWKPITSKILEVVSSERKFIAESEWIKRYATEFGIADCALIFSNQFTMKYKTHGLLLNLHSNTMEQAYPKGLRVCMSKEVRKVACPKAYKTQKSRGVGLPHYQHSDTDYNKMVSTRSKTSGYSLSSQTVDKIRKTKKQKSSIPGYGKHLKCKVFKDGAFVTSGLITTVCRELGHKNWQSGISHHIRRGETTILYHGYQFILE